MPDFEIDEKYSNPETLADVIDDIFSRDEADLEKEELENRQVVVETNAHTIPQRYKEKWSYSYFFFILWSFITNTYRIHFFCVHFPLKNKNSEFEKSESVITDAEAYKICTEWKEKYTVVIGVSWGNLPYDLQQKWVEYSCDYHKSEPVSGPVSS